MVEANLSQIPMDPVNSNVQQKEEESMSNGKRYQSFGGALMYVVIYTRPDVAIAASILGRKVSSEADCVETKKKTLRYLTVTADLKLKLGGAGGLQRFVDADLANDKVDRKSNPEYVFKLRNGPISCAARKQQCVSLSSTKTEYVSLSEASQKI